MNVHVNAGYLPGKIFEWSDEIEELKIPRDDKIHEFVLNACIEDRNRSFIRQKSHSIFQTYIDSCKAEALLTTQSQDPSKFPKLYPYSTPYTNFRLIHAYSCLGDLNAAIRALNQWKHVRVWVLEIQKTRHEIYSREYTIDKDHVDSFPPPSIKALASLARCFATCSDFTGARNFFKREVFDDAVISNLWSKKIKERDISIKENIKDLERELENCKANKRTHLKDQIESLKGHLKQQIKINDCVGVKGPLEYVYSSFSKGWNQRLDSFYKVEGEVDEEWASATGAKIVEPELLSGGIDTSAMEMEMFFKEMIVLERKAIGMFLERIEEGGQLDQFEDGQEV